MESDFYYGIGSAHLNCQDFALNTSNYVILSDGCSSAPNSDWGSRILVKCCQNVINSTKIDKSIFPNILESAIQNVNNLQLNQDCLFATLLLALAEDNKFKTYIIGDGCIVAKQKDRYLIINHYYSSGAPYYLYYLDSFDDQYRSDLSNKLIIEYKEIVDNQLVDLTTQVSEPTLISEYLFDQNHYDMVLIMSDGIHTFMEDNKLIPLEKAMLEVLNFKSFSGKFVQRRCQKMLKKIKHTDDFSIGAICK